MMISKLKGDKKMNTDKIYAEQIANEYAPKKTSKVVALKKLDQKAKRPAEIFRDWWGHTGKNKNFGIHRNYQKQQSNAALNGSWCWM